MAGKTQKKAAAKKRRRAVKPAGRRHIFAVVLVLLSTFLIISFFAADALIPSAVAGFLRGLFGFGFYIIPFTTLLCVVYLFIKLTPPDRIRRFCSLALLPFVMGMLFHLLFANNGVESELTLYEAGKTLEGGGLLSGGAAGSLIGLLSKAGAYIVVLLLLLFTVLYSAGITFRGFLGMLIALGYSIKEKLDERAKEEEEYLQSFGEEPEYEEEPAVLPEPRLKYEIKKKKGKADIDIPLDDEQNVKSPSVFDRRGENTVLTAGEIKAAEDDDFIPGVGEFGSGDEATVTLENVFDELSEGELQDYNNDGKIDARDEIKAYGKRIEKAVDARKTGEQKPYEFPPIDLLREDQSPPSQDAAEEVRQNAKRLREMLHDFGIEARVISITRGPSVTRYELQLSKGVKFSKMTGLSDDIALALGAQAVRIAPIPDKIAVGVEVPNKNTSIVYLRDIIASPKFGQSSGGLSFALGKDISGEPIVGDISKLPHMLVAGTTGSGKSVCVNSLIVSILYRYTPEEVQLLMIDPKIIELGVYNGIPHLIVPVVVDPKKAASALGWAVTEMMRRYKLFSDAGVRNIIDYNAALTGPEAVRLPQMVIVIDELADLMLVAAKEVEEYICRIAQMARAAGMHLIIATQRPSADVITGLMKANIPSRIAFAVASQLESRIILDQMGAEKLIGKGDMLFNPIGSTKPVRIQGCFITSAEVESVVDFIKQNATAQYSDEVLEHMEKPENQPGSNGKTSEASSDGGSEEDVMLEKAIELVVEKGMASTSFLQRWLKLGYPRAVRIMDMMEERGIVGPYEGSKPRTVLISKQQYQEMRFRTENNK